MGKAGQAIIALDKQLRQQKPDTIFSKETGFKMHNNGLTEQRITFSKQVTNHVYLIGFRRDFGFKAGQILGIALEKNGPRRLYSICSGNQEEEVKILYNVVEEGFLTPRLSDLRPGDRIWITQPRGKFLYDAGPAMWIATGTGIAPFYSMMKSNVSAHKILLHGERSLDKFYFSDEFFTHFGDKYIRCSSKDSDNTTFKGRVTDYLRQKENLSPDIKYYLCGRAEMVIEVRDILIRRGIPFEHIISEIYF